MRHGVWVAEGVPRDRRSGAFAVSSLPLFCTDQHLSCESRAASMYAATAALAQTDGNNGWPAPAAEGPSQTRDHTSVDVGSAGNGTTHTEPTSEHIKARSVTGAFEWRVDGAM